MKLEFVIANKWLWVGISLITSLSSWQKVYYSSFFAKFHTFITPFSWPDITCFSTLSSYCLKCLNRLLIIKKQHVVIFCFFRYYSSRDILFIIITRRSSLLFTHSKWYSSYKLHTMNYSATLFVKFAKREIYIAGELQLVLKIAYPDYMWKIMIGLYSKLPQVTNNPLSKNLIKWTPWMWYPLRIWTVYKVL